MPTTHHHLMSQVIHLREMRDRYLAHREDDLRKAVLSDSPKWETFWLVKAEESEAMYLHFANLAREYESFLPDELN